MVHNETVNCGKKKIIVDNESLQQLMNMNLVREEKESFIAEEKDEEMIREVAARA